MLDIIFSPGIPQIKSLNLTMSPSADPIKTKLYNKFEPQCHSSKHRHNKDTAQACLPLNSDDVRYISMSELNRKDAIKAAYYLGLRPDLLDVTNFNCLCYTGIPADGIMYSIKQGEYVSVEPEALENKSVCSSDEAVYIYYPTLMPFNDAAHMLAHSLIIKHNVDKDIDCIDEDSLRCAASGFSEEDLLKALNECYTFMDQLYPELFLDPVTDTSVLKTALSNGIDRNHWCVPSRYIPNDYQEYDWLKLDFCSGLCRAVDQKKAINAEYRIDCREYNDKALAQLHTPGKPFRNTQKNILLKEGLLANVRLALEAKYNPLYAAVDAEIYTLAKDAREIFRNRYNR